MTMGQEAPVPLCISGVTTTFMQESGTVDIWAKDFDLGSFDNCTDISFTIVKSGDVAATPDSAAFIDQANYTFTCNDVSNFYELDVYVWDQNGNHDYCTVGVLISGECNRENESSQVLFSGSVHSEVGEMIEDVAVTLQSNLPEYPMTQITDNTGEYEFDNNPIGYQYLIDASKDDDHLNGVSTLDIVLIQKEILGTTALDSPYKLIAADVTKDNTITALDIINIRKLILGYEQKFVHVPSWNFVDAAQDFFDERNPWTYRESIESNPDDSSEMIHDFIGIKMGDVSGNAIANSLQSESRSNRDFAFTIRDMNVVEGQTISIPVYAESNKQINGYQFTAETNGLTIKSVSSAALDIRNEHYRITTEGIVMSWNSESENNDSESLFMLEVIVQKSGNLKEMITMNSSIAKAEAYLDNQEIHDLKLEFITEKADADYALYQNEPNPFVNSTIIGFELAKAGKATLSIFDVDGKLMKTYVDTYDRGYHEIRLERNKLNISGVGYYQLESGDFSQMKKMIVLD